MLWTLLTLDQFAGVNNIAYRTSNLASKAAEDISNISEQEATRLVGKAAAQIHDYASALALIKDGKTVPLLLHLLRSPNSGEACARWAPSDLLRNASTVAGTGLCDWYCGPWFADTAVVIGSVCCADFPLNLTLRSR